MSLLTVTQHPMLECLDSLEAVLAGVVEVEPIFMSAAEKKQALLRANAVAARVGELGLRVLQVADDVAAEDGMRDPAAWLAHHAHLDQGEARRRQRLARALGAAAVRGRATVRGRRRGSGPDGGPRSGGTARRSRSRPRGPRRGTPARRDRSVRPPTVGTLGRKVLQVIAPEVDEEHERRVLEGEEAHAYATTSLRPGPTSMARPRSGSVSPTLPPNAC